MTILSANMGYSLTGNTVNFNVITKNYKWKIKNYANVSLVNILTFDGGNGVG